MPAPREPLALNAMEPEAAIIRMVVLPPGALVLIAVQAKLVLHFPRSSTGKVSQLGP